MATMDNNEPSADLAVDNNSKYSSYQRGAGLDLEEAHQDSAPGCSDCDFQSFGGRRWRVIAAAAVVLTASMFGWAAWTSPADATETFAQASIGLKAISGLEEETALGGVPFLGDSNWLLYPTPYRAGWKGYSDWFSEDEYMSFNYHAYYPITGIQCGGRYCDNKRIITMRYKGAYYNTDRPLYPHGPDYETQWFSEENPEVRCPADMLVRDMDCSGRYCDNLKLTCNKVTPDNAWRVDTNDIVRTDSFSEEQGEGYCPQYYYLHGMECYGKYCDRIRLTCAKVYFQPDNIPETPI